MLDQRLQHVDVALGADPAADPGPNGQADVEGGVHGITEDRGIQAADAQFLPLVVRRHLDRVGLVLESRHRIDPHRFSCGHFLRSL